MKIRRRRIGAACVVAALLVCSACSEQGAGGSSESSSVTAVRAETPDGQGQVVTSEPGLDAWQSFLGGHPKITRMVYRSTSGIDESSTTVSGAVFVPGGDAPEGGWPLIAYAHGTTGITRDCAPSDQPGMFGDLAAVRDFLNAGYAVVTTDYQGLGERTRSAPHPYLEPRTAAYNVIDAARAARSIDSAIGQRWLAVGRSQGGAAAWATGEEYASYGSGSGDLVGVVAVAPLLDATYLVSEAQDGRLSVAQRFLYPLLVQGVAQADPSIRPDDHIHTADGTQPSFSCASGKTALAGEPTLLPSDSFTAVTPAAAQRLTAVVQGFALPQNPTKVPILAVYGSIDDVIPPDVMQVTLARACSTGDRIVRVRREGQGHSLDPGPIMASWMHERLANQSAPTDC